jgi:hypothetical protein
MRIENSEKHSDATTAQNDTSQLIKFDPPNFSLDSLFKLSFLMY